MQLNHSWIIFEFSSPVTVYDYNIKIDLFVLVFNEIYGREMES